MDFTSEILGLPIAHWLVLLSAGISLSGAGIYIRDTLRGITKPNRVSYVLWSGVPFIATAAALSAHADGWATFRIFMSGFNPFLILLASFVNPKSYWKLTRLDWLCGAFSVLALVIWALTDSPQSAILFAAIADGLATFPTLRKAWQYPETETGVTYIMSFIAALIILPAIPVWNIENSAFQAYLLTANSLLLFVVYRKKLGIRLRGEV